MLSFTAGMRIFVGIEPVDMRGYAECGVMRSRVASSPLFGCPRGEGP